MLFDFVIMQDEMVCQSYKHSRMWAVFCSNKGLFQTMKRLAIIAGKGHLPIEVAKTATAEIPCFNSYY